MIINRRGKEREEGLDRYVRTTGSAKANHACIPKVASKYSIVLNGLHLVKGVGQQGRVGKDIDGLRGQAMRKRKANGTCSKYGYWNQIRGDDCNRVNIQVDYRFCTTTSPRLDKFVPVAHAER